MKFQEFKKDFINKEVYKKRYLSKDEISIDPKKKGFLYDKAKNKWYEKIKIEVDEDNLSEFISLKILEKINSINTNITSCLKILIFWNILIIISLAMFIFDKLSG